MRWVMAACLVAAFLVMTGCQELGKVSITVEHETEVYEVDLDAQLAIAVANKQIPGWDLLPDGECIEVDVETLSMIFAIPPENVDLEDSPQGEQVAKYKDRVEAVDIDELTYVVMENSLSFDVPSVSLSVGDFGAAAKDLAWVADTEAVTAGKTGSFSVTVTDELMTELAGRLEMGTTFAMGFDLLDSKPMDLCKGDALGKVKAKAKVKVTILAQAL